MRASHPRVGGWACCGRAGVQPALWPGNAAPALRAAGRKPPRLPGAKDGTSLLVHQWKARSLISHAATTEPGVQLVTPQEQALVEQLQALLEINDTYSTQAPPLLQQMGLQLITTSDAANSPPANITDTLAEEAEDGGGDGMAGQSQSPSGSPGPGKSVLAALSQSNFELDLDGSSGEGGGGMGGVWGWGQSALQQLQARRVFMNVYGEKKEAGAAGNGKSGASSSSSPRRQTPERFDPMDTLVEDEDDDEEDSYGIEGGVTHGAAPGTQAVGRQAQAGHAGRGRGRGGGLPGHHVVQVCVQGRVQGWWARQGRRQEGQAVHDGPAGLPCRIHLRRGLTDHQGCVQGSQQGGGQPTLPNQLTQQRGGGGREGCGGGSGWGGGGGGSVAPVSGCVRCVCSSRCGAVSRERHRGRRRRQRLSRVSQRGGGGSGGVRSGQGGTQPTDGAGGQGGGAKSTWVVVDAPPGSMFGSAPHVVRVVVVTASPELARLVRKMQQQQTTTGLVSFESYKLGVKVPGLIYKEASALYTTLLPLIIDFVAESPKGRVCFTGSGAGGSLATVLGLMAASRGLRPHCMSPLVVAFDAPPVLAEVVNGALWGCGGAQQDACEAADWNEMVADVTARGLLSELGLPQNAVLNIRSAGAATPPPQARSVSPAPGTTTAAAGTAGAAGAAGSGAAAAAAAAAGAVAGASKRMAASSLVAAAVAGANKLSHLVTPAGPTVAGNNGLGSSVDEDYVGPGSGVGGNGSSQHQQLQQQHQQLQHQQADKGEQEHGGIQLFKLVGEVRVAA